MESPTSQVSQREQPYIAVRFLKLSINNLNPQCKATVYEYNDGDVHPIHP